MSTPCEICGESHTKMCFFVDDEIYNDWTDED